MESHVFEAELGGVGGLLLGVLMIVLLWPVKIETGVLVIHIL